MEEYMKPYKIIRILVFSFLAVTIVAPGNLLMGANELTEVKNIPNPFSPSIETTLIRYNLSADCKVTVLVTIRFNSECYIATTAGGKNKF